MKNVVLSFQFLSLHGYTFCCKSHNMCNNLTISSSKQEKVLKEYLNYKFQQPYQQAFYYISLLLKHRMWQRNEFLEVLPHIDADSLMKFVPQITSRTFFECYVAGLVHSLCYLNLFFLHLGWETWILCYM